MTVENAVRALAGFFVVASLALGYWVHPGFLLFTAFVGLNLFQSSFTGLCPLEKVLVRFGLFGCGVPAGRVRRARVRRARVRQARVRQA